MIWWQCRRRPSLGPAAQGITWSARWRSLSGVIETLLLFALVIGGMFAGWFTPTEAAAVGAAGSLLIAVVRRQLSRQALVRALMETARTSCMVMIIVAGAVIFGRFLAVTRIHFELATWLTALAAPPWMVVALIVLFYLVCGCFIDALGLVMLTILRVSEIQSLTTAVWFGVIIVVVTQMGISAGGVNVVVSVWSGWRCIPLKACRFWRV